MKSKIEAMIEEFQCPGCVCGSDTSCSAFKMSRRENGCDGHVVGTAILGIGSFALGLPIGFNKAGWDHTVEPSRQKNKMDIRLWENYESHPQWDHLNIPVWAMVKDDNLFVRSYSPRINETCVEVIAGGDLSMCPGAVDVSKFIDEID